MGRKIKKIRVITTTVWYKKDGYRQQNVSAAKKPKGLLHFENWGVRAAIQIKRALM